MAENATIIQIQGVDQTKPAIDSAIKNLNNLNNAQKEAEAIQRKAARQMRQGFAQAGYQIQDIAVQFQGGQNPFIILGQQGSQIASIFGAGGIVVGAFVAVGAAIASAMMPHIFKATDALEALEKAGADVDKTFKALDSGTLVLSDSFLKMAQASSVAATIELRRQRTELLAAMDVTRKEVLEKAGEFNNMLARASAQVDPLTAVTLAGIGQAPEVIAAEFKRIYGVSEENMARLQELSAKALSGSAEDLQHFLRAISEVQLQPGVTKQFNELAESLAGMLVGTLNGAEQIEQLDAALADLSGFIAATTESSDKNTDSVQKMIESYERQVAILDMTSSQIAVYDAQLAGANDTQQNTIRQLAEEIEARTRLNELTKQEEKAVQDLYKAQENAFKVLEKERTAGMSSVEKIQSEFDERIRITYESLSTLGMLETEHAHLLVRLNQEKSAAVAKALSEETSARKEAMATQVSTMQGMAAGIANSLAEGSKAQKAAFVVSQGLAIAETIMSAELAAVKALAAIPPPANIAMSNAIRTMGYISAGIIAGQTVGSFEGGGFTGYGARVGGLDGKGGMPAIVHPNETIIDHTKGGAGAVVNINITANDTRGFDELLTRRRGMIANLVQSSLNNAGRTI
jgi:hypothetical protein